MSESAIIFADLAVSANEAPVRAAATAAWLLDRGVIQRNDHPDPIGSPSQYLAGSAVAEVAPGFPPFVRPNNGVDILDQRQAHHSGGNYTPPTCPTCTASLGEEAHFALIEPWLNGVEPEATCPTCAVAAPLGDWDGPWAIHVANLAVRFNNWPPLVNTFVDQLHSHLGPRCRMIYQRI
jgi:hypothetical protein